MLIQILPECLATGIRHPFDHQIESTLSDSDRAHAVVDSTWSSQMVNVREISVGNKEIPKAALYNL
jgi:hypothetical protein